MLEDFGAMHHEASPTIYMLNNITEAISCKLTQLFPNNINAIIDGPLLIAGGGTPKVWPYTLPMVDGERARRVDACAADRRIFDSVVRTARRFTPLD